MLSKYDKKDKSALSFSQTTSTEAEKIFKSLADKDSDNDGLKDWEESLWKTDPNLRDTDKDGTSDSDEVKQNRNPTVKGPKDKLVDYPLVTSKNTFENNQKLDYTARFARDVFSRYMTLKQAGVPITPAEQEHLAELIAEDYEGGVPAKRYKESDLKIGPDDSSISIKIYGNEMGLAIFANSFGSRNEGVILKESLEKDDPRIAEELLKISGAYKKILGESLKVIVPPSAVPIHLKVLNAYSEIIVIIDGMAKVFDDPLTSLIAIKNYQPATLNLSNAFADAKKYFRDRGIFYTREEAGYVISGIKN